MLLWKPGDCRCGTEQQKSTLQWFTISWNVHLHCIALLIREPPFSDFLKMLGFSSLTTSPTWVGCDVYLVHHIYGQFQIMFWKFPISDQKLGLGNSPPSTLLCNISLLYGWWNMMISTPPKIQFPNDGQKIYRKWLLLSDCKEEPWECPWQWDGRLVAGSPSNQALRSTLATRHARPAPGKMAALAPQIFETTPPHPAPPEKYSGANTTTSPKHFVNQKLLSSIFYQYNPLGIIIRPWVPGFYLHNNLKYDIPRVCTKSPKKLQKH